MDAAELAACGLPRMRHMGAKSHDELNCWQLSVEFRDRVNALLATGPFRRRFKYCEQLADAAESVPSNIAEGFYRFTHAEFARYLRISLGSLGEAQTRLGSARAGPDWRGRIREPQTARNSYSYRDRALDQISPFHRDAGLVRSLAGG
jgi:four helix bundle protein